MGNPSSKQDNDPVVAVIAAHGKDRVDLLIDRALLSVKKNIGSIDRVLVVDDNEDPLLTNELIRSPFDEEADRSKIQLIRNHRTKHMSGTGAWNTGIIEAFKIYGGDCWIAILDDDDEWIENHVQSCLEASKFCGDACQWVATGIVRRRVGKEDDSYEPIPMTKPVPSDFFSTNPGVQGSNLFVKTGLLLKAGLFDEALPSTTDRDLCIRLCDQISRKPDASFASTNKYTVIHYADNSRSRVSEPGSRAKCLGLSRFFFKHGPRMDAKQRASFMKRSNDRFQCDENDLLLLEGSSQGSFSSYKSPGEDFLLSWSDDRLELNRGTKGSLPLIPRNNVDEKGDVIFGIISSDMRRLKPLLADLGRASASNISNFRAFVVILGNNNCDHSFTESIRRVLDEENLRGYVLDSTNEAFWSIIDQCQSTNLRREETPMATVSIPLPISLARTVLQVFIFSISRHLHDSKAVVILDDDKRLPRGWSPLRDDADNGSGADLQIGRDLRTPPNPTLLSLRTNLLDVIFAFDLAYYERDLCTVGQQDNGLKYLQFFRNYDAYDGDKFDWYYDKSSSRTDQLEMPAFSRGFSLGQDDPLFSNNSILQGLCKSLLVGTPFARDVIPPKKSEHTLQRGGCLVIPKKSNSSYDVLATEQDAPKITLYDGKQVHSRRSDSFHCRHIKKTSPEKTICVNPHLYVYHDNSFDSIPSPSDMRRGIVQEVLGAVLCRRLEDREDFKDATVSELKLWRFRIQGLLTSLRSRPYYYSKLERDLIHPLENIFSEREWKEEVFSIIQSQFALLKNFEPRPSCFDSSRVTLSEDTESEIKLEWQRLPSQTLCGVNDSGLNLCDECTAFNCECNCISTGLASLSSCQTKLPVQAMPKSRSDTEVVVCEPTVEGGLQLDLIALVKGNVKNADNVHVRIHSECLTGDVFGSLKCDCGEQKDRFLRIMDDESHAVFLYIRGHEGRGAGLFKKIMAYFAIDRDPSMNHIRALEQQGCQADARKYDAAVKFLQDVLQIKSLVLYTNNPEKMSAVSEVYGKSNVTYENMSTLPNEHNGKYLKEKVDYLDHNPKLIIDGAERMQ